MTNKTAHTPGPWRVTTDAKGFVVAAGYAEPGVSPEAAYVARTVVPPEGRERENARLIAAAPELLEALRAILTYSEGTADTSSRCVEVEDAARAAIAKATGDNSNA